jgi:hypothetical protein
MKLRYKKIEVRMQQGASIVQIDVPEWTVPVIQAIHPEVTEISDVVVDMPTPSVSREMNRMKVTYGAEREEGGFTGIAYVEAVYGQNALGLAALKRAMQAAVLPDSTPVTPQALSPVLRQDLLQAISDTSSEVSDLIGADADADELETA